MTTETTTAATPADPLARASLAGLAAYRAAQDRANAADAAFRAAVHPKVWEAHKEIGELDQSARDASDDYRIAELCRHFPAFAPALRLTWEHIIDTPLIDVGTCCSPIEPAAPPAPATPT